jgi:hypothetical protein
MSFFLFCCDACNGPLDDLDDLFISQSLKYKYPSTMSGEMMHDGWCLRVPYLHRLSNAPFSLKDGFSVVVPMSLIR